MLKKFTFAFVLCLSVNTIFTKSLSIKAIFVDVEALFETNDMKASKYVGKIDSLRYLKNIGHLPSQADLFKALTGAPAQSTLVTYNNNLTMPLLLSDWLMNTQSAVTLLKLAFQHLSTSKLSDIEKKVLGNIVKMMMNPAELIDTQQTISVTEKLIAQLKQNGYKVYLVGNWSNQEALQKEFSKILQTVSGIYFSGKLHQLKPYKEFYDAVLTKTNLDKTETVWIEKEQRFISKAKEQGLKVISFSKHSMSNDLKNLGVRL